MWHNREKKGDITKVIGINDKLNVVREEELPYVAPLSIHTLWLWKRMWIERVLHLASYQMTLLITLLYFSLLHHDKKLKYLTSKSSRVLRFFRKAKWNPPKVELNWNLQRGGMKVGWVARLRGTLGSCYFWQLWSLSMVGRENWRVK